MGCSYEDILSDVLSMSESGTASDSAGDEVVDRIVVYNTDGEEISSSESVLDTMEDEDNKESFLSAADLVSSNDRLFEQENVQYAYSMLNDEEQSTYKEIYAIMSDCEEDVVLSTKNPDIIDRCFRSVLVDHPEIFYVTGYSISKYTREDEITKITYKGSYTMSHDDVLQKQQIIDSYVAKCLSGISQNASDYEKVKYVYEYLIHDNTYELGSENNQNILSVCENRVTVCQGYAKMTQLLLNKLGVFCTLVNGTAENSGHIDADGTFYEPDDEWGAHVWNIVKADGQYYNVDTTWGDSSFLFSNENGDFIDGPEINYDFLMIPDSVLTKTHLPDPVVEMPACTSMDCNYYVVEGMYFTDVNTDQLKNIFDRAYANGDQYVSIKCSNADVYEQMRKHLFKNEKVFNYLHGSSVRYVEYQDRDELSVYL